MTIRRPEYTFYDSFADTYGLDGSFEFDLALVKRVPLNMSGSVHDTDCIMTAELARSCVLLHVQQQTYPHFTDEFGGFTISGVPLQRDYFLTSRSVSGVSRYTAVEKIVHDPSVLSETSLRLIDRIPVHELMQFGAESLKMALISRG